MEIIHSDYRQIFVGEEQLCAGVFPCIVSGFPGVDITHHFEAVKKHDPAGSTPVGTDGENGL